jgi:hypothetical protein
VKRRGRKTKYRKEFARIAKAMCKLGATDYDLAQEFEVATSTIWRWSSKYPEFCSVMKVEKASFDDRVEWSLAQRALVDFVPHVNHGSRVLAKCAGQDDSEIAQGNTNR